MILRLILLLLVLLSDILWDNQVNDFGLFIIKQYFLAVFFIVSEFAV
jgi:hypothetical protein